MESKSPKMVKYVDDECYGISYHQAKDECVFCWIKRSCEANFKSAQKKKMMAKKKKPAPRPKSYKKTAKYREW